MLARQIAQRGFREDNRARRRAGPQSRLSENKPPRRYIGQSVNIFGRVDFGDNGVAIDMFGQGKLYENAVDFGVSV